MSKNDTYLDHNKNYWEKGYHAPHVESYTFRFLGRILKPDFGIGGNFEKLVDFGCGQGAAVNYFAANGFNARGVDISDTDIQVARTRFPHLTGHFNIINPNPHANEYYGFRDDVSVVVANQSLYYFNDLDFEIAIKKIHASLRKGGIFFATMMGTKSKEFFDNSQPSENGLRVVNFKNKRVDCQNYYMSFITDETHLKQKFKIFKPVHVGYYSMKLREDEGDGFHYTFCGVKE